MGNRHPAMAPHGCYPCVGEDQWVTIAVRDDADWRAFCGAIGEPELAADARYATVRGRLEREDMLDAIVSEWTGQRTSYQVMEILQGAGVPAGPVLTAGQALADPHFRQRGFFERVDHPADTGLGTKEYIGRGWKFSGSKAGHRRACASAGRGQRLRAAESWGYRRNGWRRWRSRRLPASSRLGGGRRRRCRWRRRWSWGGWPRLTRTSRDGVKRRGRRGVKPRGEGEFWAYTAARISPPS